jgi:hypothetical protein
MVHKGLGLGGEGFVAVSPFHFLVFWNDATRWFVPVSPLLFLVFCNDATQLLSLSQGWSAKYWRGG